jgi:hypothetical protein
VDSIDAATVDDWLAELSLAPIDRGERDGVSSWDLKLDGRLRADIRLTLILDPASAMFLWAHFAPPLNDSFRVSYRQFLRWNDELPFVKFALSADERPVLTAELPVAGLDVDALGSTICRLLAVCDLTLERSVKWLWPGAKAAPPMGRASRQATLFERYSTEVAELTDGAPEPNAGPPELDAGVPEPNAGAPGLTDGTADLSAKDAQDGG